MHNSQLRKWRSPMFDVHTRNRVFRYRPGASKSSAHKTFEARSIFDLLWHSSQAVLTSSNNNKLNASLSAALSLLSFWSCSFTISTSKRRPCTFLVSTSNSVSRIKMLPAPSKNMFALFLQCSHLPENS